MPTPANRTPLRVARGTYSNLNSSVADIQEGEICYATDQDKLYVKEGSALVSTQAALPATNAVTDVAQTFTAAQRGGLQSYASTTGATNTDFNLANNFSHVLSGNTTFNNPTNQVAGQSGSIFLVQDGTGSRTAAWGSHWDFASGTAPTLSTGANKVDRIDYIVRASSSIHAVFTADYS
jgi:hypothetical protein